LVRLVLRLTRLAKGAALATIVGILLAVYGRLSKTPWAGGVGSVLFFGGVLVYFVERLRMTRLRHRPDRKQR